MTRSARPPRCLGGIVLWLLMLVGAPASEIHVAPDGNDQGHGTAEAPFATLHRARDAARAEIARGLTGDLSIILHRGAHHLGRPLDLGPEDGGTAEHRVTWRSDGRGLSLVSGGVEIGEWTAVNETLWRAEIPAALRERPPFRQLYASCLWLPRARFPNDETLRVATVGEDRRSSFDVGESDLPALPDLGGIELVFFHDWSITRSPIQAINGTTLTLPHPIAPQSRWAAMDWFEKHPRYFLENARAFLDAPKEWYADWDEGYLYVVLPAHTRMDRFKAVAPQVDQLLVVQGAPDHPVRNLHVEGLHFRHAGWRPADGIYFGRQAGTSFPVGETGHREADPATIHFEFAEDCSFTDGSIRQCGGHGFWFGRECRNNVLEGVNLSRLGGNGILIGEGQVRTVDGNPWWEAAPEQAATGNRVNNCSVFDCGREMFGAVGIWVGLAEKTEVLHNRLQHLPYTGISVGWMWWDPATRPEPRLTPARENRIAYNHIHNVMLTLSDGAGIYTLGQQPGSALVGNLIHDIPRNVGRAESNGMFLDQGTGSFVVEDNLVYDVGRSPFRFHKGWTNVVRNNTVSLPEEAPLVRYNDTKPERIQVSGNRNLPPGDELDAAIKAARTRTGVRKADP